MDQYIITFLMFILRECPSRRLSQPIMSSVIHTILLVFIYPFIFGVKFDLKSHSGARNIERQRVHFVYVSREDGDEQHLRESCRASLSSVVVPTFQNFK